MSHYTEAVIKEIHGINTTPTSIKLVLDAVPDFSIKKGGDTYLVWCEGDQKTDRQAAVLTKQTSESKFAFDADVAQLSLVLDLKGKRVRLHAAAAAGGTFSISSLDLV